MKKNKLIFLVVCSLQLLSCESIKKGFGLEKSAPNEFLVEKRKSILLPPDYDLLLPDSKKESTKSTKEQDLKTIFNEELKENIKSESEIKKKSDNLKSEEIENKILNNIK